MPAGDIPKKGRNNNSGQFARTHNLLAKFETYNLSAKYENYNRESVPGTGQCRKQSHKELLTNLHDLCRNQDTAQAFLFSAEY
jgi:hypothetical protein